jgi:hypothetical protein
VGIPVSARSGRDESVSADGEHWQVSFDNAYLLAGIAAIVIAAVTRNLLGTIGGGLLVFFLHNFKQKKQKCKKQFVPPRTPPNSGINAIK